MTTSFALPILLLLTPTLAAQAPSQNWVIPAGTTETYDTTLGPLTINSLWIQEGATLRVSGPAIFRLTAASSITVDGSLDLSGADHPGVLTLNTAHIPELGASGSAGAGSGGVASWLTTTSTPMGGAGFGPLGMPNGGGEGGSGAGSGGFLVMEAPVIDLSQAPMNALSAIGGQGGPGANDAFGADGSGGNGGPGVIQLHTADGTDQGILLPSGAQLADLSAPNAHVLVPHFIR